jgi:hypothetical protein
MSHASCVIRKHICRSLPGRALARNTGCRRRFEFCAPARDCNQGWLGLSVLRRPAHGCVSSYQRKYAALSRRFQPSIEVPSLGRASWGVNRRVLAFSRSINLQVRLKRRSCGLRLQPWYASPSKCKARLRLHERGLTLPSSGRAFGTPLKSNVRRRTSNTSKLSEGSNLHSST